MLLSPTPFNWEGNTSAHYHQVFYKFAILFYELYYMSPPVPFMNAVQLGNIFVCSIMHAHWRSAAYGTCVGQMFGLLTQEAMGLSNYKEKT